MNQTVDNAIGGYEETPVNGWRTIGTAPKDGTRVLLSQPEFLDKNTVLQWRKPRDARVAVGFYDEERCMWFEYQAGEGYEYQELPIYPTHWMPLPLPPQQTQTDGE